MAEFRLTHTPSISPTQCFFCEEFVGPFIDSHVDLPGFGRVYICAPREDKPGCLGQMAILAGYVEEAIPLRLQELVQDLQIEIQELKLENDDLKQLEQLVAITRKRAERVYTGEGMDLNFSEERPVIKRGSRQPRA